MTETDSTEPKVVYHYTSADTLLKIVENERIWASNIGYLNDVMERQHCIDMLQKRLPVFLESQQTPYSIELEESVSKLTASGYDAPYVASFSVDRDSLPLWRSYCPNGNGVSIGFRVSALRNCTFTRPPRGLKSTGSNGKGIETPPFKSTLEPVEYVRQDDWEKIDSYLLKSLQDLEEWHTYNEELDPEEQNSYPDEMVLETSLSHRASLVKHSAFEAEREYRLFAPPTMFGEMKFRASRTTVIPYFELCLPEWRKSKKGPPKFSPTFDDYFIEEVVVGPTPNPKLTFQALDDLFRRKFVHVPIDVSKAPYRDL
jgi:hypothetical protein